MLYSKVQVISGFLKQVRYYFNNNTPKHKYPLYKPICSRSGFNWGHTRAGRFINTDINTQLYFRYLNSALQKWKTDKATSYYVNYKHSVTFQKINCKKALQYHFFSFTPPVQLKVHSLLLNHILFSLPFISIKCNKLKLLFPVLEMDKRLLCPVALLLFSLLSHSPSSNCCTTLMITSGFIYDPGLNSLYLSLLGHRK